MTHRMDVPFKDFDTTQRIPVITDVVRAGDPKLKKTQQLQDNQALQEQDDFESKLQERISQLESIIGSHSNATAATGLGRAHVIRREDHDPEDLSERIDQACMKHLDKNVAARVRGITSNA